MKKLEKDRRGKVMTSKNYLYCLIDSRRSEKEIYAMLARVTLIANLERQKGNKEHASIMTAVGFGLRWVVRDYDFGLEEPTKPKAPKSHGVGG